MWRMERAPFMQAGAHLAQAIEVEPDYAAAHAWYAYWHVFLVGQAWTENPAEVMAAGGTFAERAVVTAPCSLCLLPLSCL